MAYTGRYTPLQKITSAVMVPFYAAMMTAYFSFTRPNVAYAQEKPAAAAEAPKFGSTVDCLIYKIKHSQTNCDKPVETVPETQPALPVQPVSPNATTGTLETTVNAETIHATGSAPAQYAPKKKKRKILRYVGMFVGMLGVAQLYKAHKGKGSSASSGGGSSLELASGDENDPSLDHSVKGDEDVQDDVHTIKVK